MRPLVYLACGFFLFKGGLFVSFQSYRKKDLVLTLPGGRTLRDLKWISVWCRAFDVNFGEVNLPDRLKYPRPQKIQSFNGIHDVKSERYMRGTCIFGSFVVLKCV